MAVVGLRHVREDLREGEKGGVYKTVGIQRCRAIELGY